MDDKAQVPMPIEPATENGDNLKQTFDAGVCTPASPVRASTPGSHTVPAPSKRRWGSARGVLLGVRAANKFTTLRDLVGTDAYIEPSRLRMVKALGEGAFAKVQLAELLPPLPANGSSAPDGKLARSSSADAGPRKVAVKVLRRELLEDGEQVQLFIREVALLRKLRHTHIVEFVGCSWRRSPASATDDQQGGELEEMFYVQGYCAGGSLGDLVRRQMAQPFKRLYSDSDALRWSLHIAQALAYLHGSRPVVIHRDLKLENVMLDCGEVSQAVAKLGDFGLARLTPPVEKEKMARLTRMLSQPAAKLQMAAGNHAGREEVEKVLDHLISSASERVQRTRTSARALPHLSNGDGTLEDVGRKAMTGKTGSYGYMAPEVSRSQQYNAQADIFSLAMCMYNLFNRTIPTLQLLLNGNESHLELYAARVAEGYRPPMLATVPRAVQRVIEACWKGSAELRPSAQAVVDWLERIEALGEVKATVDGRTSGCRCSVM